jgi:hypothetical protein
MNIADAELAFVKSSGTVVFQSLLGNIAVSGVVQHADLSQAQSASVQITASASKTITFDTAPSTFHTLTCSSAGGIDVEYDLQTHTGALILTSSGAALALSSEVDIISAAALTLTGNSITVATSIFDAVGDITIGAALTSSAGEFLARTNRSITISADVTNTNRAIKLISNRDCDASTFTITVDANCEITGGSISLY